LPNPSSFPPKGLSALIIEVTDDCNLRCPTCIAGSEPGAGNTKKLDVIQRMISAGESCLRKPDILMISGGEPTIHPEIVEILQSACNSSIDHVMLITNGKRIAEENGFAEMLSLLPQKIEIYLQFDSLNVDVLRDIRGEDLSDMRKRAIVKLDELGLPVTLVCVVKKGLNDDLCGEVIKYALQFNNIRGVTFQPIKAAGRTDSLKGTDGLIDLANVRRAIINANVGFQETDLVPHPMNPENICIGYLIRKGITTKPVTNKLMPILASQHALSESLFFLPKHNTFEYNYNNLFRVAIVSFMDKYNFFEELIPFSTIGFLTPLGHTIPLDSYYMYGRVPDTD
jgi:uncharacterized radical SAM superfamily Fe-S cluster-containing enzyme